MKSPAKAGFLLLKDRAPGSRHPCRFRAPAHRPVLGRAAARRRVYARAVAQPGVAEQTKFLLDESQLPRRWYNIRADMPTALRPVLHPGTGQPVGPDDLAPLFPMELILQEVSEESEIAIPDEVLELYRLWRPTPLYRAHRLERAVGTRRAHLLQVRGRQPARQPQAEHGGRPGLLQQEGGTHAARHRDRRGPVGQRARVRVQADRARVQGLHGPDLVRAEAVPALADPGLGRDDRGEPVRGDAGRQRDPRGVSGLTRAASGSRSPRRSRTRPGARTPPTRSAPCSTTCSCTRR